MIPDQPDPRAPQTVTVAQADGAIGWLADRVTDKLTREGLLAVQASARAVRLDLDQKLTAVWDRGHVSVGELWGYYCRHPYLTRLRDRSVLDDAVQGALVQFTWATEGFALAEGWDDDAARYVGLVLPRADARFGAVTDTTLLVHPLLRSRRRSGRPAPRSARSRPVRPRSTRRPGPRARSPFRGGLSRRSRCDLAGSSESSGWTPSASRGTSTG